MERKSMFDASLQTQRLISGVFRHNCSIAIRRKCSIAAAMVAIGLVLVGCGGGGGSTGGGGTGGGNINGGAGRSDVLVGATLSPGFDLGVDSSGGQHSWVSKDPQGFLLTTYQANQQWGAVFITAGMVSAAGHRTTYDYSSYNFLVLDLKGANGGEQVSIGVKTESDPDDGSEPKYLASNLTTAWQTLKIPMTTFVSGSGFPASRFSHLYVVGELVYPANSPESISVRNLHFEK